MTIINDLMITAEDSTQAEALLMYEPLFQQNLINLAYLLGYVNCNIIKARPTAGKLFTVEYNPQYKWWDLCNTKDYYDSETNALFHIYVDNFGYILDGDSFTYEKIDESAPQIVSTSDQLLENNTDTETTYVIRLSSSTTQSWTAEDSHDFKKHIGINGSGSATLAKKLFTLGIDIGMDYFTEHTDGWSTSNGSSKTKGIALEERVTLKKGQKSKVSIILTKKNTVYSYNYDALISYNVRMNGILHDKNYILDCSDPLNTYLSDVYIVGREQDANDPSLPSSSGEHSQDLIQQKWPEISPFDWQRRLDFLWEHRNNAALKSKRIDFQKLAKMYGGIAELIQGIHRPKRVKIRGKLHTADTHGGNLVTEPVTVNRNIRSRSVNTIPEICSSLEKQLLAHGLINPKVTITRES